MFVALSYPFIVPTMFRPSLVMTETDSVYVAGGGGLGRVAWNGGVGSECAWSILRVWGVKRVPRQTLETHREARHEAGAHYNHTPAFHARAKYRTSDERLQVRRHGRAPTLRLLSS